MCKAVSVTPVSLPVAAADTHLHFFRPVLKFQGVVGFSGITENVFMTGSSQYKGQQLFRL